MTSEVWFPVFLDADVLAAPLTRTLLILCGIHPAGIFAPRWSPAVEVEADRHMRSAQTPVRELRHRFDWGVEALVPDASPSKAEQLTGTSPKDRHVLAAAAQSGIRVIVSRNVEDFGDADLNAQRATVAHPDLFLSSVVAPDVYRDVLDGLAAIRSRPPNTSETLHSAIGAEHPRLHQAMSAAFPGVEPAPSGARPPGVLFRGHPMSLGGIELGPPESRHTT
jgi:hypothetical protein